MTDLAFLVSQLVDIINNGVLSFKDIFVKPIIRSLPLTAPLAGMFFGVQHYIAPKLLRFSLGSKYESLSNTDKNDCNVRLVAVLHAVLALVSVPLFFLPPELSTYGDSLYTNWYLDLPWSRLTSSLALSYFTWDICVSFYYNYDIAFKGHAIASLMSSASLMYPFMHFYMRLYHGLFEISTPFIHLAEILKLVGMESHSAYTILLALFFGTFTVFRIFISSYYTFTTVLPALFTIYNSPEVHSLIVIGYMICTISFLTALQFFWWSTMLKQVFTMNKNKGINETFSEIVDEVKDKMD